MLIGKSWVNLFNCQAPLCDHLAQFLSMDCHEKVVQTYYSAQTMNLNDVDGQFGTDIHGSESMNCKIFDPLLLVPFSCQNLTL